LFVFLSIHISALLFPDDGLIQGVKKDQRNCPNLQSFPLSSFPHSGATEICFLALIFFSILQILPFFFFFLMRLAKIARQMTAVLSYFFLVDASSLTIPFSEAGIWQFQ